MIGLNYNNLKSLSQKLQQIKVRGLKYHAPQSLGTKNAIYHNNRLKYRKLSYKYSFFHFFLLTFKNLYFVFLKVSEIFQGIIALIE